MHTDIGDIFMIVGLDFLLFLLLFLAFALYRRLRSRKVDLSLDIDVMKPYMDEAEHSLNEIGRKVRLMELEEIYKEVGEWAYIYLSLHRNLLISLVAISVPGICGLMVIYYFLAETKSEWFFQVSGVMGVINRPDLLIYFLLFLGYASGVIYALGVKVLLDAIRLRNMDKSIKSHSTVVMIKNIPKGVRPEFVNEVLDQAIRKKFPNLLRAVYTVPCLTESYKHYLKVKEFEQKLKLINFDTKNHGEKVTVRKCCKKIDAIDYYERKKTQHKDQMVKCREDRSNFNSGIAFVLFNNTSSAKELLSTGIDLPEKIGSSNLELTRAPAHYDILWENIGLSQKCAILLKILLNTLYFLVFLIIITPSVLEEQLKLYMEFIGISNFVLNTLAINLPALVLFIYQAIILPPAVEFLVINERHTKKHLRVTSSLKKYLVFLFFYTFLFPILQLQVSGMINLILYENWEFEIATRVNYTVELFFVFMIHQVFLKNGFDLLATSKYFYSVTKALLVASSRSEEKLCYEAQPFEFDYELAVSLNNFIIICGFSVIFPLILVPGLVFFAIRYLIHRHNILSVYYVDKKASAFPSLLTCLVCLFLSAFIMQIIAAVTLLLSADKTYQLVGKITIFASFFLLVTSCVSAKVAISRDEWSPVPEDQLKHSLLSNENQYRHPMDRINTH